LFFTDDLEGCSTLNLFSAETGGNGKVPGRAAIDLVASGPETGRKELHARLAGESGGVVLKLRKPEDVDFVVERYTKMLGRPLEDPILIANDAVRIQARPGKPVNVPNGVYSITLPNIPTLEPDKRAIREIRVLTGQTIAINVSAAEGKISVSQR
jgi:hypothetical protein